MNPEAKAPMEEVKSVTQPPNGSSRSDGMIDAQKDRATSVRGKSELQDHSSWMGERRKEGDLVDAINLQNYEE